MSSNNPNMIAGWALAAALLIFGGKTLAEIAWHEPKAAKPGYTLPVTVAKAGGAAVAFDPKAVVEGLKKVSAANVEAGQDVFKKCAACHTPNKGGENKVGPNLWGSVGRKVGAHAGFGYSEAVKGFGGEWGYDRLAAYLYNPAGTIPGNKMAFAGVKDTQDLVDVIAYMRSIADAPAPLPQ